MLLSDLIVGVIGSFLSALILFLIIDIVSDDLLRLRQVPIRTGIISWIMLVAVIEYAWHFEVVSFPDHFFILSLVTSTLGSLFPTWVFLPMKS